ncbi:Bug family tripartite tricarboxylate transporter substrate binding protein [Herbaspirillum sp. GCM10030257]|uniref:Bug family tripartite tricarboxylate transporter substrate binding protein n=1 Tax=Herbaspirillum sp. GCM10030257 TaxID=3273393 RepID=UPI003606EAEE
MLGAVLLAATVSAFAQNYPDRVVRLVVPFPPGGPTDTAARIIGQKMGEGLKQQVIVENRPGASGMIGAEAVAKSAPDGYTIMMLATPTLLVPHLTGRKNADVFKDFTPIGSAYDLPIVMVVNPDKLPEVTSLQQYVAKAKAQPGAMNYTSAGNGSFGHLSTELLKNLGKFDVQHIPYKGSAPAIQDLLGGQVSMMFSDMIAALPHIKAGKLRPIAVGSTQRVSFTPEVKTVAEQGFPGFDATAWGGLLAPAGTPKEIVDRINKELQVVLADKDVQAKMLAAGTIAAYQPPQQMAKRMQADYERWGKVIRDNGIKGD